MYINNIGIYNLFQTTLKVLLINCIADSLLFFKNWWSTVYKDKHIKQKKIDNKQTKSKQAKE